MVCFFTHTKKQGEVSDSPGMPGGVFRYFPLKCCITTSHFSVDSILQQHKRGIQLKIFIVDETLMSTFRVNANRSPKALLINFSQRNIVYLWQQTLDLRFHLFVETQPQQYCSFSEIFMILSSHYRSEYRRITPAVGV